MLNFRIIFPVVFILGLVVIFLYYSSSSSWCGEYETKATLFTHKKDKNTRIEFQQQDCGAIGSNRRIVKVEKGFFSETIQLVDTSTINKSEWRNHD